MNAKQIPNADDVIALGKKTVISVIVSALSSFIVGLFSSKRSK